MVQKQLEVFRSIWLPIRNETINVINKNKDEVMDIVHKERAVRIGTSVASIVLGGTLVATGIALAPFTFGGSIGLSVAGAAIGGLASAGGIAAFITSKVMTKKRLKKAQEHISLDQQLSLNINDAAYYIYTAEKEHLPGVLHSASTIGTFSQTASVAAIAAEGTVESTAIALRTGGRIAGMALAGVSLAVTVPIDIGFIAYHSYQIHKSSKDKTGKTKSNAAVQWLIQQTENLLKGIVSPIIFVYLLTYQEFAPKLMRMNTQPDS